MLKYDIKKTEEVLQYFYTVTKIKCVLIDGDFSVITAVPFGECSFCTAMSKVPEAHERCRKCDRGGLQLCRSRNESVIYHCHAGLIEAVVPIRIQDITAGYIMVGQFLHENANKEEIIKYSSAYIGDTARSYLEELIPRSDNEIYAATKILEGCVYYLIINRFIQKEYGNLLLKICQYIEENPAADLSVEALCRRFDISRNYIYKLSNTYLGMPIAAYVRNKRLKFAEKLINEGYSVTAAAERAGFYDYGYFGKIFKKHIGKTPKKVKSP